MRKALAHLSMLAAALGLMLGISTGCNSQINSSIATFNAQATKVANAGGQLAATLSITATPTPTPVVATYDISSDSSALLIHAWGQAYALPSGSQFTIIATQQQVGDYIIQNMQLSGFQQAVKGGSATIGSGQVRLDLSLVDTTGASGTGTITFQPTLDASDRLKLNPIGNVFGTLQLPDGLLSNIGDSVQKALTGAASDALSKATVTSLALEDGTLKVSGTVK